MSIDELISGIPEQIGFDDVPNEFAGTVTKIEKTEKKNEYAGTPQLSVTIQIEGIGAFVTTYRIPKAMTGRGQLDKLLENLKALKINSVSQMQGKTFKWVKTAIEMGNPRHYPTILIE